MMGGMRILLAAALLITGCTATGYDVQLTGTGDDDPIAGALSGWASADIGPVPIAGTTAIVDKGLVVRASGNDLCEAADAYRFVYHPVRTADFRLTAHITELQMASATSEVGIMVRESLEPGARYVAAFKMQFVRVKHSSRSAVGGLKACSDQNAGIPLWLQVTKRGDRFTTAFSMDAKSWTMLGEQSVHLDRVLAGIVVTSGTDSALTSATVDSVKIAPGPL